MTNCNERTNTLLYKNIPLTFYPWRECFLSVRGELETRTDCYILTQVLLTIVALLSHSGWAAQQWVTEGLSPLSLAGSHSAVILSNWLQLQLKLTQAVYDTWLYNCLMTTRFCLFTQVHSLIDRSVEGQYVTCLFTRVHLVFDVSVEGQYITFAKSKNKCDCWWQTVFIISREF